MPESQNDIDALLAEVNALAEEAVATIAGGDDDDYLLPASLGGVSGAGYSPSRGPSADSLLTLRADGTVPRSVKSGRIPTGGGTPRSEDIARLLSIEVPIIVQLSERTMALSEILNLTTGSIIEFDKPADGDLELKVNNKIVGSGQAVKVGENFGLRVSRLGTLRERIQALGGQ